MQTQSKIAHHDILSEFKRKLNQDWKRTNWVGQVFYVRDEIYEWMIAGNRTNAVRLLVTVNRRIKGGRFPEIQSSDLFKPGATCFIVFAILLSLDYGHLIHIFHKHSVNDYRLDWNLEEWKDAHQAIQADLEEAEGLGASRVIAAFQERKWAFNPVPLTLMMHNHLKGVDWILPFAKCRKVAEGGTATVYQVLVQEELLADDFREAIAAGRQNHESLRGCYEFAIKEYTKAWEPDFKRECHAFMAIRGQEGMVQFLGQFVRDRIGDDGRRETTYNILLEYGEFDLEEFFGEQQQYPPVLQLEIVLFWESFFKVADAISRVHNLTIRTEDGQTKIYNGWHADIKPENILRVYGEFKLADFGFAKFSDFKGPEHTPESFIDGGTAAYGAPETDVKRLRQGTLTPVTQTIDTWSFGCVLSITATWVILGVQGVYQYQQVRKAAISKLDNRQRPSSQDAFHDGQSVLPQVLDWHRLLRASMRKCDPITDKILDLIEERMLVASPLDRIQCKDLCKKLDSFIEDAHRACHRPEVSITQDVMTTLLEFDRRAPSTASEAEEIKAKQKSLEGTLDADAHHAQPGGKLAIPTEPGRLKSKRFPKPDRQVIIQGKFAHRTLALKSALAIMRESSNESPPSDIDRGKHPENSRASPFDAPPRVAGSPTPSSLHDSPHQPGSFDSPINRLSADLDQLSIVNSVTNPAWHGHQTDQWEKGKVRRPTTDMASRHTPPPIVLTEEPHQMTPKASPAPNEFHTGAAPSAAIEGPLYIQPPQGPSEPPARTSASPTGTLTHHPSAAAASPSRPTTPGTTPKAVPHMSPYRHLADCNEAICKERIRLDTAKRNAGFFRKPKKDEALKDLISARDFIFVVDRAPTMIPCWEWATFLVETLAMKLARIDDDGLDLVFTNGAAEYNLTKEKSASAFKLAMQRAEPKVNSPKTDMSICLGEISRSYWSKVHRKKLTLIIITDGMWGLLPSPSPSSSSGGSGGGWGSASMRENPVDNKITNFVNELRAKVGESKVEDRWFSIQFISFATDPLAHAYLKFLDSSFWKKHGIPDVIDTKPWHHPQVENLILGSLNIYADDDSDDEGETATTTPADTGTASSQYGHRPLQYDSQAGGPSTTPTTAHSSLSPTPRSLSRSPSRREETGLSRSRSKRKSWLSGGLLKKT